MLRTLTLIPLLMCLNVVAQVEITIKVSDQSDQYINESFVHVHQEGAEEYDRYYAVPKSGEISIQLPNDNMWHLTFAAPHYYPVKKVIFPGGLKSIDIDAKLGHVFIDEDLSDMKLVHSDAGFDYRRALRMEKGKDGIFRASFKSKSKILKYSLFKAAKGVFFINGQTQDSVVLHEWGHLQSVINVKNQTVEIEFDPKKSAAVYSKGQAEIRTPIAKERTALLDEFIDWKLHWRRALSKYKKEKGTTKGFKIDESEKIAKLDKLIAANDDLVTRKIALMSTMYLNEIQPRFIEGIITLFGTDEQLWSVDKGRYLWTISYQLGDEDLTDWSEKFLNGYAKQKQYFDAFINDSKVHNARKNFLNKLVYAYSMKKDRQSARQYLNILKSDYPGDIKTKSAIGYIGDDKQLKVGSTIPDFKLKDMNNGKEVSRESMKGKVYLLDFWATWCSPCLKEMPYLHKASEKFSDKGFEVVSIALWDKRKSVEAFHNKTWNMPWKNIFVSEKEGNKVANLFEIEGLPKAIMVDQNGKIIAMNAEVKAEKLEKTIKSALMM